MSDQLNPIERDLLDVFREFVERIKQENQAEQARQVRELLYGKPFIINAEPVTCDRAMAMLEESRKQAAWWEATAALRELQDIGWLCDDGERQVVELYFADCDKGKAAVKFLYDTVVFKKGTP